MSRNIKVLELTLSEECNLRCLYCYEQFRSEDSLTFEMAQKLISDFFERNRNASEAIIGFHGGEVLLQFDLLRSICEWMWKQTWPIPYVCKTLTNGTLMHGEIADWFLDNKERFRVQLSYDGTPAMQDKNRSNSAKFINLAFFRQCWPKEYVKMTISPNTIENLFEGCKYLHSYGFNLICNLAYWIDWSPSLLDVYHKQLRALADWYILNPEVAVASVLNLPIDRIAIAALSEKNLFYGWKWCGCGESDAFYSPQGKKFPCQGFMPSVQGRRYETLDFNTLKEGVSFKDDSCGDCKLYPVCGTCCAENFAIRGSLSARNPALCDFRKVEIMESARMYAKMLQQCNKYPLVSSMSKFRRAMIAKSILMISAKEEGDRSGDLSKGN